MPVNVYSLHFQPRDLSLLRSLFESRIMTAAHAAALHFDGSKEAAKKRLQKLKAAGYIAERTRRVNEPSVLFLTSKSFSVLRDHGILAEYPRLPFTSLGKRADVKELTIRHELNVMDVKAAFHSGVKKTETLSLAKFSTWPLLHQFETQLNGYGGDILVKPDGFIHFREKDADGVFEHTFFLEVDRSTETLDTLATKAAAYGAYYRSGGYAERNGATRLDYKDFPFRVLMVFPNAERRNNMAEKLIENTPPILTQVCLSTFPEVTTDPLGAIWISPRSYRDITMGTPFQTGRIHSAVYRRDTERDNFVEKVVVKFSLLA